MADRPRRAPQVRTALRGVGCAVPALAVGSGLAALAQQTNDPCWTVRVPFALPAGWEGFQPSGAGTQWFPFGTRCAFDVGGGRSYVATLAPGVPEALAWIVMAAVLIDLTVRRPHSAFARGAAVTAGLLALMGWAWHEGDFNLVVLVAIFPGGPLVICGDLVRTSDRSRSLLRATCFACAVVPSSVVVCLFGRVGVVAGVLIGGGVLAGLARGPRAAAVTA